METGGVPRWLDDDEHTAWRALAALLRRLPAALDAQLFRDAGLNLFEYEVMAGLSMAPRRTLRMSVIAHYAQGSLPRLSQAIGRMEARGWVRRRPDPDDGRATLVTLNAAGMRKVAKSAPGHVQAVQAYVLAPLSQSQARQLMSICRRIVDAIDDPEP